MITIVTGPTHCGKSTYIAEHKNPMECCADIFDFQEGYDTLKDLTTAQYNFLRAIEDYCRESKQNMWIEGCFSNPYRIGQIINTIRAAGREDEIRVIYILRDEEWYLNHLDIVEGLYAAQQIKYYKFYNDGGAAVYKLINKEVLEEVK